MSNDVKRIAIIPARSGSKGLKDKNIKLLNGKPLIVYSIDAAIKSNAFDIVFVSTDSEIYAEIAMKAGADAHFLRSEINSSDKASSWDTVREVIQRFEEEGKYFDEIMLLQPTSPLRTGTAFTGNAPWRSAPTCSTPWDRPSGSATSPGTTSWSAR